MKIQIEESRFSEIEVDDKFLPLSTENPEWVNTDVDSLWEELAKELKNRGFQIHGDGIPCEEIGITEIRHDADRGMIMQW